MDAYDIMDQKIAALRAENKKLKEDAKRHKTSLEDLTNTAITLIDLFDKVATEPASEAKGKKLAAIIGKLEFQNDKALHFGLGYSFKKMNKLKGR